MTEEGIVGYRLARVGDLRPGDLAYAINGKPASDPHVFFVVGVFPAGHDCPKDMRDRYMTISYIIEGTGLDFEEVPRNLECYLIKRYEEQ